VAVSNGKCDPPQKFTKQNNISLKNSLGEGLICLKNLQRKTSIQYWNSVTWKKLQVLSKVSSTRMGRFCVSRF